MTRHAEAARGVLRMREREHAGIQNDTASPAAREVRDLCAVTGVRAL